MSPHARSSNLRPPAPLTDDPAAAWMLDPDYTFLSHGAFGARLKSVYEAQQAWRRRFEARPIEFLNRRERELLDAVKHTLGAFIGMQPENFGFTTNATDGVNAVLRSLRFERGDELVMTDHTYLAVKQTLRYVQQRDDARLVDVKLPLPLRGDDDAVEVIAAALTDRTRLVVIDHITSPTAILLPVERIIGLCDERGVDVLVDGAHAPGMVDLDVERLGAAYYAGNLHKWVSAPPGSAFLWVRPDRQRGIHPNIISFYLGEGFAREFSWQGTRDISAWLAVKDAIEHMDALAGCGSWPRIMAHNHALAAWAQATLCAAWDVEALSPIDGSMLGAMAAVTLPPAARRAETVEAFQALLYDEFSIEVPIIDCQDRWVARPCCQVYNSPRQIEQLADAVITLTS